MRFDRPFRSVVAPAAALSLALLAGCSSAGLSPRESERQNYSSFVYSLYDLPAQAAPAGGQQAPARPPVPARLAVAQVGEVAPPEQFLEKLRSRPDLFPRVQVISGVGVSVGRPARGVPAVAYDSGGRYDARRAVAPPGAPEPQPDPVVEDVAKMQRLARDMGMDHLLVVGGTIDHATTGNALSILDLTIIGAFVVPSKQIDAKATAAGALIDLDSGKVVLTASADASNKGVAATATQEGAQLGVLRQARDEVVNKLAESFVKECERRRSTSS